MLMLVFQGWGWYACALKVSADLAGNIYDRIMSLLELGPVIFRGVEGIKTYLRYHQLLATQKNCSRCVVSMRERLEKTYLIKLAGGALSVKHVRVFEMGAFSLSPA